MCLLGGILAFNCVADANKDETSKAVFLIITLVAWTVMCVCNCGMQNRNIHVPRTNDTQGCLQMSLLLQVEKMSPIIMRALSRIICNTEYLNCNTDL